MSEVINDGGPVHPIYDREWDHGRDEWRPTIEDAGMTIRDHFAGLAMQAVMACAGPTWRDNGFKPIDGLTIMQNNARLAYDMADAMLKARGGP